MKSRLLNLLLVGISLVVALAVAEGALRIVKINTLSNIRVVPGEGVTRVPGVNYIWKKEGFSEGRFNGHGFRDVERSWDKPPGTFRIALLGDSYTEGLQVPLDKTFSALLEAKLNASSTGPRFEVLNLGQSGFGTTDEYGRWLNFGTRYDPDLVLVAFYPGNDIRNNSKKLNIEDLSCYFVIAGGGELELDCSALDAYLKARGPVQRAWQAVKRHSYLASLVSERLFLLRREREDRERHEALPEGAARPEALDPFADGNVYLEAPDPAWSEAFLTTEAAIARFDREVRAKGQRFALVTISTPEQVDPRAGSALQSRSAAPLDFDRPERRIGEFARSQGIPVLALGPLFEESFAATSKTLHGFGDVNTGHWNERGHALAAEAIFRFLVTEGLVPVDSAPPRQAKSSQN
jgi:hypothetical protein